MNKNLKKYAPTIIFILTVLSDMVFKFTNELDLTQKQQTILKAFGIILLFRA